MILSTPTALHSQAVDPIFDRYRRAERFLPWNQTRYVINGTIHYRWIPGSDRLLYLRQTATGESEFIILNARTGSKRVAFTVATIQEGLRRVLAEPVDANRLRLSSIDFEPQRRQLRITLGDRVYRCSIAKPDCRLNAAGAEAEVGIASPDGRWVAFVREHNLWVRSQVGQSFPLTTDGIEHAGYGESSGNDTEFVTRQLKSSLPEPLVLWAPNSRHLLAGRVDEREVDSMSLVQSVPGNSVFRPMLHSYRYTTPQSVKRPQEEMWLFDVTARRGNKLDVPPIEDLYHTLIEDRYVWWSRQGRDLYFVRRSRYSKSLSLFRVDTSSGHATELLEEHGPTFVEIAEEYQLPRVRVLDNGDFIWFSERDGWGHLYYYRSEGSLRNRITQGTWAVRDIIHVEERPHCRVYYTANGREPGDPYFVRLYRSNCDGSGQEVLTPEDADHEIGAPRYGFDTYAIDPARAQFSNIDAPFSPTGAFFVDHYSRPDIPPVTVLRATNGRMVTLLERADDAPLEAEGLTPAETFRAPAADGSTPIFGSLFKPSHFDPTMTYPVLDSLYPGPQRTRVSKQFLGTVFDWQEAQAIAELGFVVMTLDGRGTPHRSKAFLNYAYGHLDNAGSLEDHVAALKQLAAARPYMDLTRLGAYGYSGGGFASARAILSYPDLFKVAVSASGDHDLRTYLAFWAETYEGSDDGHNYEAASNASLAGNLRGKLLLVHGEMDDNVHPSETMRLADALIRSNRDFDFLILPNANHASVMRSPYFIRRRWDYLVRNLRREDPPNYEVKEPPNPESLRP